MAIEGSGRHLFVFARWKVKFRQLLQSRLKINAHLVRVFLTSLISLFINIQSHANESGSLDFKRCTVKVQAFEMDAECATFKRAENPDKPSAKVLELAAIKLPSHSPKPESDAFTIIQGGPGGSSIDLAISYARAFDFIRQKRDILVIDQRGTGRSNMLACDPPKDTSLQFDIELVKQEAQRCVDNLSKKSDLRFYSTSVAVDDLEALRDSAGYSQLNLYGVSYGTRVAQHYMRKYPDSTRSVILDSVAPVGLNLAGGEVARRWEEAFNSLIGRCNADKMCAETHGDLRSNFLVLNKRFAEQDISVSVPHPRTTEPTNYNFNEHSLFSAIRLMTYSTEQLAMIPLLLSEARKGNYTFLASQIIRLEESFNDEFAVGMHNSVACTEDAPFVTEAEIAKADGTLVGRLMSDAIAASCSVWPTGTMDDAFREPFSSNVPTLILSGENDPITPPSNGDTVDKMLSNSKHIVVPAHGHGVVARGCVPKLASLFIENANFDEVDTRCVERERAMPIFSTQLGPKP